MTWMRKILPAEPARAPAVEAPIVLTDEQCAAMDETAEIKPEGAGDIRNTLIRAAAEASARRFEK